MLFDHHYYLVYVVLMDYSGGPMQRESIIKYLPNELLFEMKTCGAQLRCVDSIRCIVVRLPFLFCMKYT